MNDKQYLYTLKWSQPYTQTNGYKETVVELLIETYLEQGWFETANEELQRIMAL